MNFDEYFNKLSPDNFKSLAFIGWDDIYNLMEQAWDAAKKDSAKSDEGFVFIVYSGIVGDWVVRDDEGVAVEDGFETKEKAVEWALQNGFRVVE